MAVFVHSCKPQWTTKVNWGLDLVAKIVRCEEKDNVFLLYMNY